MVLRAWGRFGGELFDIFIFSCCCFKNFEFLKSYRGKGRLQTGQDANIFLGNFWDVRGRGKGGRGGRNKPYV